MRTFTLRGILLLMIAVVATATAFECNAKTNKFLINYRVEEKLSHRGFPCRYVLMEKVKDNMNFLYGGDAERGNFTLEFKERPDSGRYHLQIVIGEFTKVFRDGQEYDFSRNDKYGVILKTVDVPENATSPYNMPAIRVAKLRDDVESKEGNKVKTLDEFTVTATKVLFYHKGDTLFYNADEFMLAEGSMLDALLKQMPGVELMKNGVITVNGERVDRLLLNGKDLFNGQNELMLENLNAYTVKDIAVYNKRTHLGELLGFNTGDEKKVMDVRLKRKYISTYIGHVDAGYGTRSKYLAKLFGMWFSDNVSVSAYAGSNNLSDESRPGRYDGVFSPTNFSSFDGVKTKHQAGLTYNALGYADKWELKGNVDTHFEKSKPEVFSSTENFLEKGNTFEYNWRNNLVRNFTVQSGHNLFLRLGSRLNIELTPGFSHNYSKTKMNETSASFRSGIENITESMIRDSFGTGFPIDSTMMNRMYQDFFSKSKVNTLSFRALANINLKTGMNPKALVISSSINHSETDGWQRRKYIWEYCNQASGNTPDRTNYSIDRPARNTTFNAKASFEQFFGYAKSRLPISYEFTYSKHYNASDVFSIPWDIPIESNYDVYLNDTDRIPMPKLSQNTDLNIYEHALQIEFDPKKNLLKAISRYLFFKFNSRFRYQKRTLDYVSGGKPDRITKKDFDTDVSGSFEWGKYGSGLWRHRMELRYWSLPANIYEMIQLPDLNPIETNYGNLDLKKSSRLNLHYSAIKNATDRRNMLFANIEYVFNPQLRGMSINTQTGQESYFSQNRKGEFRASIDYDYYFRFGKGSHFFMQTSPSMRFNTYDHYLYKRVNNITATERLRIGWFNSKINIALFSNAQYYYARYIGGNYQSVSIWWLGYGADFSANLPKNWSITSKLNIYTRRGYSDRNLNDTNFIWNANIGKSFFKGKLYLSLECYDILRQLSNIDYTVNARSRIETVSNFIPNYFLLQVRWNFR